MGMFDRIFFKCEECGYDIEAQSKAGGCNLEDHSSECVPVAIADDLENEIIECCSCGSEFKIISLVPLRGVPMGLIKK